MNILNSLFEYYKEHKGRVKGALFGFIFAVGVLIIGILKTIFIAFCVILGYYIGKQYEADKDFWRKLLDKVIPPGRFR